MLIAATSTSTCTVSYTHLDVYKRQVLVPENEGILNEIWTLQMGDQILSQETKAETVRHALNQIVHHRAQLGVYYRLLGISLPSTYGPSAVSYTHLDVYKRQVLY